MKIFSVNYGASPFLAFFVAVLYITGYAAGNGFAENIAKDASGGLAEGSLYNGTGNAYGVLGSVTGTVTDVDGTALSAVVVHIGEAMDITTDSGQYTIENIIKGTDITITATGEGYEPYTGIVDVEKKIGTIINIMMVPIPSEPDPVPSEPIGSGVDTTSPEAVTELITKVVSSNRIDLSWNPSTDGDGSRVAGYRVYRNGVETGVSTSTVYSDTGLSPTTAYCYTVTAYDTEGNESTADVQACTTTSPLQSYRSVTLAWDAPTTNEEGAPLDNLAGYRLYYGTSTGNYTESFDVGNKTQYTIENLLTGLYYYFAVTAYNTQGNESTYSSEISTYLSP